MTTIKNMNQDLMANILQPFEPTHPGEVIKSEIEYRGISQKTLAEKIGVAYTQLNEILNAKRPMNTEVALLLEAALDIDAEPLMQMQARYDMAMAHRNRVFMEKLKTIRKVAAVL